jgi:hypothetical protein
VGSNPAVYWMVVSDAGYYIPNERNRIKVAKWGTPKKQKKKNLKRLQNEILQMKKYLLETLLKRNKFINLKI